MERASKRPRLSIFHQSPTGDELDSARHNNDLTLKNRFESIFAKYSQDFSGIGDEIDLMTGKVVVNNGHLEGMEAETDPGVDHFTSNFTSTGRSMLRAMTVDPNPDLPGPDDVLMSIETIAENAALVDESSADESEDNLFGTSRPSSESVPKEVYNKYTRPSCDTNLEPYRSDSDSLFDERQTRSPSVDSLFQEPDSAEHLEERSGLDGLAIPMSQEAQPVNVDDEIIARFGPHVGKEVLDLMTQRKEAHIEPAWRIPVQIDTSSVLWPATRSSPVPPIDDSPEGRQNKSLWTLPKATRRRKPKQDVANHDDREESIDPLQEDFFSEHETSDEAQQVVQAEGLSSDSDSDSESGSGSGTETGDTLSIIQQVVATGECPYCHAKFVSRHGVMQHWDRHLRRDQRKRARGDPHDIRMMRSIRLPVQRPARLNIGDFKTLVELHEGAGMSFDEISASKTLQTRKSGPELQTVYGQHRSPRPWIGIVQKPLAWSQSEDEALHQMCSNPSFSMLSLRHFFEGRDDLEIGNYLAEMWLARLGTSLNSP